MMVFFREKVLQELFSKFETEFTYFFFQPQSIRMSRRITISLTNITNNFYDMSKTVWNSRQYDKHIEAEYKGQS